jgi:hyperosmotically inducible protein
MKVTLKYGLTGNILMLTGLMIVLGMGGCQKEGEDKTGTTEERASGSTGTQMESAKGTAGEKTQSAGDYIDDAAITTKVKAALLNEPTLSASRIDVTTTQGIVKLSGTVDSEQGISRARELAGNQQGVKSVTTDLSVSTTAPGK